MLPTQVRPSATSILTDPEYDITVRVGCSLAYEVTGTATLLLNLRPQVNRDHRVRFEALSVGNNLSYEQFSDSHGNEVLRVELAPGTNCVRHDAIVGVSSRGDNHDLPRGTPDSISNLPPELLRYTMPSRYCDSDKLLDFAWSQFGAYANGIMRVRAICDWVHHNIEYRYGSGRPDLSASEVISRRYGVCRDFAHAVIALCRAFNLPTRYVTGHLPDVGFTDPGSAMDFHAYAEVYLGHQWHIIDARFNVPRIGRIKVSHGLDAVDTAFSTIYGEGRLDNFLVWAYQVNPDEVQLGDPIDMSKRLDGTPVLRFY